MQNAYCYQVSLGIPKDFLGGSVTKKLSAKGRDAGDAGLIPGSGRSPGEGNSNRLQCSCLGNPVGRGVWWAPVHGVTKSWIWLSDRMHEHIPKLCRQSCLRYCEHLVRFNLPSSQFTIAFQVSAPRTNIILSIERRMKAFRNTRGKWQAGIAHWNCGI